MTETEQYGAVDKGEDHAGEPGPLDPRNRNRSPERAESSLDHSPERSAEVGAWPGVVTDDPDGNHAPEPGPASAADRSADADTAPALKTPEASLAATHDEPDATQAAMQDGAQGGAQTAVQDPQATSADMLDDGGQGPGSGQPVRRPIEGAQTLADLSRILSAAMPPRTQMESIALQQYAEEVAFGWVLGRMSDDIVRQHLPEAIVSLLADRIGQERAADLGALWRRDESAARQDIEAALRAHGLIWEDLLARVFVQKTSSLENTMRLTSANRRARRDALTVVAMVRQLVPASTEQEAADALPAPAERADVTDSVAAASASDGATHEAESAHLLTSEPDAGHTDQAAAEPDSQRPGARTDTSSDQERAHASPTQGDRPAPRIGADLFRDGLL